MPPFHALDKTADAAFLRAGVSDPLTRVAFRPTNRVVRCATCGMVVLRETWEAVGGCPNGHPTAAPWDPRAALTAPAGDGSATPPPLPPRPGATPPARPPWLVPALAALAVAALVGVLALAGVFSRDAPEEAVVEAPAAPEGPQAVSLEGDTVEGALEETDFRGTDGRYRDLYTFAADSSGRRLTFTLTAGAFAPDLVVETPDGRRVEGRLLPAEPTADGAPGTTRRVVVPDLRGPGLYRLTVSSRMPDVTGRYTLTLRQEADVQALTPGAAALQGELGRASLLVDGFYRDTYRFTGAAGREHVLRVGTSAFAPVITITGPGGAAVRAEPGRTGTGATFTFTPEASGAFTVVVSSRERGGRGPYTVGLTVAEAPPPPAPRPDEGSAVLARDAFVRDSLAAGQTRTFFLNGRVGDRVTVEVRGQGFAPGIYLAGPSGVVDRVVPGGERATIRATLATAGRYRVEVTGTGAGPFSLEVTQTDAPTSDRIPRLPGQEVPSVPPAPAPGEGTYRPAPIPAPGGPQGGGPQPGEARP